MGKVTWGSDWGPYPMFQDPHCSQAHALNLEAQGHTKGVDHVIGICRQVHHIGRVGALRVERRRFDGHLQSEYAMRAGVPWCL